MATYSVQYVHAVSSRHESFEREIHLHDSVFADRKALGAALRDAGVLGSGGRVTEYRRKDTHDWVAFPRMPGLTTYHHCVILTRTDLYTVIGRGKAGWHASRPGCSSSGGTLEPISGTYADGRAWTRPGYLAEAKEGCRVYDASEAEYGAFASFIISGPMLSTELGDEQDDCFSKADADAARRMLPGLSGGFEVLAAHAIAGTEQARLARQYGGLDRVGWGVYRRLLGAVGGVRFGVVRNGAVVWETAE